MCSTRASLTLLFLFFLTTISKAQYDGGLLFRSYESPIASRTSLHLSPDEPLEFNHLLQVSFQISFWRMTELGYLLRFSAPDNTTRIDLLYRPGEGSNSGGIFKLTVNGQENGVEINVPAEQLVRNNWLNINVVLDKQDKELRLTINQETATLKSSLLNTITSLNPVFGRSPFGLPSSVATPRFGMKNLTLTVDNNVHTWALTKGVKARLASAEKTHTIEVNDPEWIIDTHQGWQAEYTQEAQPIPGIAFDGQRDEIYIVEENLITVYNLANRSKTEFKPKNSFPKDQGTQAALYSTMQEQLYGYNLGPEKAYTFNRQTATWENQPEGPAPPIYIWQHAPFENTLNGNPMFFGGYGFFTARDTLWELNPSTREWNRVPLKGDIPEPRFMLGVTEGYGPGEYYLYGGYGNKSGKQEVGYQNLSDLYLLNLNDSSITKVWGQAPGTTPYLPSTNMVLNREDSAIYAIGYAYLEGQRELELLKISITEPETEVVALREKLPFDIKNIGDYNLFLYYATQTKELVSVLRINTDVNTAEVRIHTISYPPSPLAAHKAEEDKIPWQLIIPGATLLLGLIILLFRRRESTQKPVIQSSTVVSTQPTPHAIALLGGFKILDAEKKELTQKLSPKLKELFLLILLHTLSEKGGISTQKLTDTLWPDASNASAKNNRGVTLQKLRQTLGPLQTVEIHFARNRWNVVFRSVQDCDLYHALEAIEQNDLSALADIAKAGTLLPNTHYEWLDDFKTDTHFRIIQFLTSQASRKEQQKEWNTVVEISRTVLDIDPMQDEALQHLIRALTFLKKAGIAKSTYEQFAERYNNLYGEPYPISFQDILN